MSAPAPTFTELLNGAAGLVVVLSGLFAGLARSLAVLSGLSTEYVERVTAIGFLLGAVLAVAGMTIGEIWR